MSTPLMLRSRALILVVLMGTVALPAGDAPVPTPPSPEPVIRAAEPTPLRAAAAESTSGPVRLQYRYEPGQLLRYVSNDASSIEVEHASSTTTISYETRTWKHYRVKSVEPDGSAVMELMLDRVQMSAEGADGQAEFDSRQPGSPPAQFAHVLESIGRPLVELTVGVDGQVTELRSPQRDGSGLSDAVERDNHGTVILPTEPVEIGSLWTERFSVPVFVDGNRLTRNIKLQRKYTLTAVEDGVATIDLETIVLTPVHDAKLAAQLIQRTPSGVVQFDVAEGVVAAKRTYLNNQVVGHEGPGSKVKVVRTFTETLAARDESLTTQAAARD